jgi:hypothetical protein
MWGIDYNRLALFKVKPMRQDAPSGFLWSERGHMRETLDWRGISLVNYGSDRQLPYKN